MLGQTRIGRRRRRNQRGLRRAAPPKQGGIRIAVLVEFLQEKGYGCWLIQRSHPEETGEFRVQHEALNWEQFFALLQEFYSSCGATISSAGSSGVYAESVTITSRTGKRFRVGCRPQSGWYVRIWAPG